MSIEDVTEIVPEVATITPFQKLVLSIGEIPTNYLDSMSYAEQVTWFCMFLQEKVLPVVDQHSEKILEIINYLNNLDLQDEVNNKLDEMTESGQLQEIIADYLNSKALFGFDTVSSMKTATNLINGSYAKTLGYYAINDNGGATYKVRNITNDDVVDERFIIALYDDNLIAELITEDTLNIKQIGAYGDDTHIDTSVINAAITYANNRGLNIYFPKGTYLIDDTISVLSGTKLIGSGCSNQNDLYSPVIKATTSDSCIDLGVNSYLSGIDLDGDNIADVMLIASARCNVENTKLTHCLTAIEPNSTSANLCIFRNVKIRSSNKGINWINNNNYNGQSCYFENVDMLNVKYGLDLQQPGNKFINLCIQNSPVDCKPVNITSNSNIFIGTYLENTNNPIEVDFNNSSYNEFYGLRPLQYASHFTNNNGKNKIVLQSQQNNEIIYNTGFNAFQKLGVPVRGGDNPSAVLEIEKDENNNEAIVKTNGSSTQTKINYDHSTITNLHDKEFIYGTAYRFKNMFFYKRTYTISNFAPGANSVQTTTLFNMTDPIYFACTSLHNVNCVVEKRTGGYDGMKITLYNDSSTDYSNVEFTVYIFGCDYIGSV